MRQWAVLPVASQELPWLKQKSKGKKLCEDWKGGSGIRDNNKPKRTISTTDLIVYVAISTGEAIVSVDGKRLGIARN